jgi:hypothetical protein
MRSKKLKPNPMPAIPDDVLYIIFSFLPNSYPPCALANSQVNQQWRFTTFNFFKSLRCDHTRNFSEYCAIHLACPTRVDTLTTVFIKLDNPQQETVLEIISILDVTHQKLRSLHLDVPRFILVDKTVKANLLKCTRLTSLGLVGRNDNRTISMFNVSDLYAFTKAFPLLVKLTIEQYGCNSFELKELAGIIPRFKCLKEVVIFANRFKKFHVGVVSVLVLVPGPF